MGIKKTLAGTLGMCVITAASMFASPSIAHEPYFRTSEAAVCDTPALLGAIKARFSHQARKVHNRSDWRWEELSGVHEHRYREQDVHKSRPIARRYCHATAHFNDGSARKIWYLIEGGMGFAGFGQSWLGSKRVVQNAFGNGSAIHNVEFCIDGLDDMNVYNAHCRVLR